MLTGATKRRASKKPRTDRALSYPEPFDCAPTAHLSIDRAGRILEASSGAVTLLGLEGERLGRVRLDSRIAPADVLQFDRHRRETMARGVRCSLEVELEVTGRPAIPVLMTVVPLSRSRTGKTGCRCSLTDLSDRRAYQQKLRRMAFDSTVQEERARRRIAADVHDRIGQSLAVAHMKLATVRPSTSGEVRTAIDDALRLLQKTLADARTLTFEISPPILYDLGLVAALRWLAEEMARQHGLRVEVVAEAGIPKLSDDVSAVLFRCVRELLVNVAKHAEVARAAVILRGTRRQLFINVSDGGRGFKPDGVAAGFGLFGVGEQVRQLGGTFEVESTPARGTAAKIVVGLEQKSQ